MNFELNKLEKRSNLYRLHQRREILKKINYIILVPTLRCNLNCTYCQVSRVNKNAQGFDWNEEIYLGIINYLKGLSPDKIKIEFQGGEPLLALSYLTKVRDFCRAYFHQSEFVVCTNLQSISETMWEFLSDEDTFISTSLDGTHALHTAQRTKSIFETNIFLENLELTLKRFGPKKVSALPTIDIDNPPPPRMLIEFYAKYGLKSIYLRPVANYGFARKNHKQNSNNPVKWNQYRREFMRELIDYNFQNNEGFEEFYFSYCLRRVLQPGNNGHVDLRNPNLYGTDYILIDYDGTFYPTDEARMLARCGKIDLSVGTIFSGFDNKKIALLNANSNNDNDPKCSVCHFQAYCGRDIIEDLSLYGRIDLDRHETAFCIRHMDIFQQIFGMLECETPEINHSLAAWMGVANFDPLSRTVLP